MAPAFDARGRHPIRPHPPSARQCQEHWYLAVNYLYLFFFKSAYSIHLMLNCHINKRLSSAGLKIGDRVVEVNGVNVENSKPRDVMNRIRMSGNVLYLLVVDPKTDGYFR